MSLSSPSIYLFYHSRWQDTRMLDELCWGVEEQGVPYRPTCFDEEESALALSKLAAKSSALRVRLGIDLAGDIVLTHAQLPEGRALVRGHVRAGITQVRVLGTNAAQLAKELPFSEVK